MKKRITLNINPFQWEIVPYRSIDTGYMGIGTSTEYGFLCFTININEG